MRPLEFINLDLRARVFEVFLISSQSVSQSDLRQLGKSLLSSLLLISQERSEGQPKEPKHIGVLEWDALCAPTTKTMGGKEL